MSYEIPPPTIEPIPRPPEATECDSEYSIEGKYRVCIKAKERAYYVWDDVPPDLLVVKEEIEKALYNALVKKTVRKEEIEALIPEGLRHVVERKYYGYNDIEPLMLDRNVIDIHIVLGQRIQVVHREYGKLVTNISLTEDEIVKILSYMEANTGKSVTVAQPLLSFIEPRYGARVTVVYKSDVTFYKGMTVDIRKQPEKPWTILKLIGMKTVTPEEAAFLWLMIKYKVAIMIVGELMSGKTTIANAILNLVPPDSRIITIEDAPELRLYIPYWTRTMTRDAGVIGGAKAVAITVFDLLKNALRLTVDYIVVGEVRGEEARYWAQGILLGHGGVTTFHANSPEAALVRLTSPPIEVNPQALELLNIFVRMIPLRSETGKLMRRAEVYVYDDGKLYRVFGYDPENDRIVKLVDNPLNFKFVKRVIIGHGITAEELMDEYRRMIYAIRKAYSEAISKDPSLETPDYKELAPLLYRMIEVGSNETP